MSWLDQWYEYNDEKVHEVGEPMVQSVQAYVLIYIKREVKLNLCLWLDELCKLCIENLWYDFQYLLYIKSVL